MAHSRSPSDALNRKMRQYRDLNTVPALVGIVFAVATVYQFGGLSEVHLVWLDYTLETSHAMLISLGAWAVAFMSSETSQWSNYEPWEQALMAGGLGLIVAHQHVGYVTDLIAGWGTYGQVAAFLLALSAWGVAVAR